MTNNTLHHRDKANDSNTFKSENAAPNILMETMQVKSDKYSKQK